MPEFLFPFFLSIFQRFSTCKFNANLKCADIFLRSRSKKYVIIYLKKTGEFKCTHTFQQCVLCSQPVWRGGARILFNFIRSHRLESSIELWIRICHNDAAATPSAKHSVYLLKSSLESLTHASSDFYFHDISSPRKNAAIYQIQHRTSNGQILYRIFNLISICCTRKLTPYTLELCVCFHCGRQIDFAETPLVAREQRVTDSSGKMWIVQQFLFSA